ncbi:hypothetical protein E2P81_ATG11808 [Venturia nashicola]|uniref:ATP-dependent RNA helicase n=1 Tax=Venturia nashicola TaxID=86259 RepID=A0A4Z1NPZ7_9PEZI|nr:hypothetical protein E6O75_ATG11499 [Venturia nashicola]TLD24472.1 hypothetical protein E2P81_ATG11808 [Venturia nashicola]
MLGALRRCTASIPRSIASVTSSSRVPSFRPSSLSSQITRVPRTRTFHHSSRWLQEAAARELAEDEQEAVDQFEGPLTKFKDLATTGVIHENVVSTLTGEMKLETMTEVQSATITAALDGTDIIAQARTGTGKTIAFLLPVLQRILQQDPDLAYRTRGNRTQASDIRAIVISPTRELAEQIGLEARRMCANTNVIVQTAVGGTQKAFMLRKTQKEGCHILVGTPGRVKDILSDPYSGVDAPKLDCFVLDEADRLLDAGFWTEIEAIQQLCPDRREKDRQTLMFSATIPREVIHLVRQTLKKGYQFVKCIQDNEAPTIDRVPQKMVRVVGLENLLPTLYELAQREIQASDGGLPLKAMVFFPSTAEVSLAASIFRNLSGEDGKPTFGSTKIYEIHSKLTQEQRTRATGWFKQAESALLFTSDVTARGMDFPNVTHVIQVGQPQNRDTYIHRVGRTGRAGKEGESWILLTEIEMREAQHRLKNLPLIEDDTLHAPKVDMSTSAQVPAHVASILTDLGKALKRVDFRDMGKVYLALLGIYQFIPQKRNMIEAMNRLARYGWGLEKPPSVPAGLARRLQIDNVPGVNISSGFGDDMTNSRSGGSRGGFGDRGGPSRGGFGDRGGSRGGFGDRGGSSRGGFGDRGGSSRGGFGGGDRPPRRDFGDRGGSSRGGFGGGDRPPRRDFGDRGDSFRGGSSRGGFGDRGGSRGGSSGGYQGRNGGGYGGRTPGGYGGDRN